MTESSSIDLLSHFGLSEGFIQGLLDDTLAGFDDGDLFFERCHSDHLSLSESLIKAASASTSQGFGLRALQGESTFLAHSAALTDVQLRQAAEIVRAGRHHSRGASCPVPAPVMGQPRTLLKRAPLPCDERVRTMQAIDNFARSLDPRVIQVSVGLSEDVQDILILRQGGLQVGDQRQYSVLSIRLTLEHQGRREHGNVRMGGAYPLIHFLETPDLWQSYTREALRKALLALEAVPIAPGVMPVILGSGRPGVLLHEAVGHGLEGDFNRKGHSVFSHQMGQQVAAKGVTVIDRGSLDPTLSHMHGALHVDDEGTLTQETLLIEDGIMVGHMCDRLNAHLMGKASTGNGRRQSYAHLPQPRMTNTYMRPGTDTLEEMIQGVKRGIYAVDFNGGQVDIVSGNFVFGANEAYLIEEGKIQCPIREATLIGNGPEVMKKIEKIGSTLEMDDGLGYCGKGGQTVVVGIGQPALLISELTVGSAG
jgi:TldD protein